MLGMYVHTHWAYHHPYAARTWTEEDWAGYLVGLRWLGYNWVMLWPQLDCMPAEPNASDCAFLERISRVIDLAHHHLGMRFLITLCPNTLGNEKSAAYPLEQRPYFVCERKINPKDPNEVRELLEGRRRQLAPLGRTDALVMIDSDPGGYIGSTNEEFVALMKAQIAIVREFNPGAELYYWMWVGWENYNRFWAEAAQRRNGEPAPEIHWDPECFLETLSLMREEIPEPWGVFATVPAHLEATDALGLGDKRLFNPYGLIEGEPTFPLTNYQPQAIQEGLAHYLPEVYPRGVMANAQTHCLQLPHTYLFAHYALGGSPEGVDLAGFADQLLPGSGWTLARAWEAIGAGDPDDQRAAAQEVGLLVGKDHSSGPGSGLLFGDPDRFLTDLGMNLQVRAALHDFRDAAASGGDLRDVLRNLLGQLRPYQERIGFVDAYGGPLYDHFNQPLAQLHNPSLDAVLQQFHDWRHPEVRNGVLSRLLDAAEAYCG